MKNRNYIFFIILYLISCNYLFSQQFPTKYYNEEEGLPDGFVSDILQDESGRIWFATRSGIGIYDGSKWTYHNNTNGLKNQNICKLQFDKFNRAWILSSSNSINVSYLDNNKWNEIKGIHYNLGEELKLTDFNVQIIDDEAIIFVGTETSGLFVYRKGYWSNFTQAFGLPSSCINSIEFYDNQFYIATPKGAFRVDKNLLFKPLPFLENAGRSILLFKADIDNTEKKLWVMGDRYIGYIKNNKFVSVTKNEAALTKSRYYYASFIPNYYNSLIYSYSQSLVLFEKDNNHSIKLSVENGLPQIGGTSIFLDREMNLWVTSVRGVSKISSMRFANYNKDNGLYKDEVTAIDEIKSGELIFGHNNGLSVFFNGKFKHISLKPPFKTNIGFNRVLDVTGDGKGNAYFAAAEIGFGRVDKSKNISWLNKNKLDTDAFSISINSKGEIFCLTFSDLYKYESGRLNKLYEFRSAGTGARKIFFDDKDIMYVATMSNGLAYSKDYKTWTYCKSSNKKEINNVYSFIKNEKYGFFVGTEAGLYSVDKDSLKKVVEDNLEINRPIYFITQDTLNNYWFGTNNGVLRWNGKNLRHYTTKAGLIGYETNRDAGFLSSDGSLWIGTDKGVSHYLNNFDDVSKIKKPVILIDSILVDENTFKGNQAISLPYEKNDITFETFVISFIDEGENTLYYKLVGYDNNWQTPLDSRSSHIRYTNLPPGKYYLALKAVNAIGTRSGIITSSKIMIEKPFYRSYYFYIIITVITVIIVFFGFKQFEQVHYSRKLEREVKARTLELNESENKYKTLLTNLQDGFFVLHDGVIKLANNALAKMLGYSVDELTNINYSIIIAPEDIPLIAQRYKDRQLGKNVPNEYEFKMIHKNRTRVYVNMNVSLSMFEGNLATVGTIKDITERRSREELLKKLSTAVKQSPNIVIITDQYGVVEYVNPTFTEVSGYTFEEIKNRNISIVKSGAITKDVYEGMWETIRKGDLWRGELINRKKNGNLYWVRSTISPIIDEKEQRTTHYLSTQEDITFEKYANEEIQKGEKLINTVLSNVPVMIFAFNKEAVVSLVKGKILDILGLTQEMIVGKSAFQLFPKSSEVIKDLKKALKGKSFSSVTRLRRHTFEVTYTPMFGADKKYSGTLGVAYNITERKKYEIELIEARDEAQKSDRLKSEFLAQMSHEIRTPINSILSFTTLLKEELKDSLPEDLADGFLFIENGAKRLIRTIDLILNMSQIQTDTYQPYYSEIDLDKDILRNIVTEFKGVASGKKIDLIYNVVSENNYLKGDSYTLGQIFANLVDNAIKYTLKGKVEIEISRLNDGLVVKVNDTGIGISSEFIPDLFTPFTQEESGYTRKFEGNGLGLALVKKYIEMNNADIKVESQKGKGTSFIVTFKPLHS